LSTPTFAREAEPAPGRGLTAPGRALSSLRHREFRFLLGSSTALQVGSWIQTIGMGWLVLHDLDGSATDLALVGLVRGASQLLIAPVGGYAAGRWARRKQLIGYAAGAATIAATLATLTATGLITLGLVYALAAAAGILDALAGPIRMMVIHDTVGPEDLTNAVALNGIAGNAMRVIGPATGGILIGLVGTQGAFQAQAAALALAALLSVPLRPKPPGEGPPAPLWRSIAEGMRYTVRDHAVATVVFLALVPSLLVYPYVTFLPVFARDVLGSNERGYGLLAAGVGVGSLLGGALVAMTAHRARLAPVMAWACFVYCLCVLSFTFSRHLWLSFAILAVAGVFHSVYAALNSSLMQLKAAPEFRGHVLSLQIMTWGVSPFAALAMGRMVDTWGAPTVVGAWVATAAAGTLATIAATRGLRDI